MKQRIVHTMKPLMLSFITGNATMEPMVVGSCRAYRLLIHTNCTACVLYAVVKKCHVLVSKVSSEFWFVRDLSLVIDHTLRNTGSLSFSMEPEGAV